MVNLTQLETRNSIRTVPRSPFPIPRVVSRPKTASSRVSRKRLAFKTTNGRGEARFRLPSVALRAKAGGLRGKETALAAINSKNRKIEKSKNHSSIQTFYKWYNTLDVEFIPRRSSLCSPRRACGRAWCLGCAVEDPARRSGEGARALVDAYAVRPHDNDIVFDGVHSLRRQ